MWIEEENNKLKKKNVVLAVGNIHRTFVPGVSTQFGPFWFRKALLKVTS